MEMTIYTEIAFRGMEPSAAIEQLIHKRVKKLELMFSHVAACRVVIEAPHKHRIRGNLFHVRIDLSAPQSELVSSRDIGMNIAHEQLHVALRDAFSALRNQLLKHKQILRVDYHLPDALPFATVKVISHIDDYGILETNESREIFFHRNSVVDGEFDKIRVGDVLRFAEELGEKGPQASSVHVTGRRRKISSPEKFWEGSL
ncbi:MAG: HPF/RaiA family ribosome-associated protein [Betaproteobacteria bacterium]|nr:HPF/RaiA family ribosome-associated protein [Betaproteobacteria bacterium]